MKSKIHLIRHGITEGNLKKWFYGAAEVPLAPEGVEALKAQVEEGIYPRPEAADYYTSGMQRTEQTFRLIYGEQEHQQIEQLREMNFGEYERKTYQQLKDEADFSLWFNDKTGEVAAPGGESKMGFARRVLEGWKLVVGKHRLKELSVRHNGKTAETVIVCHGGVISAILESLFPSEKEHFYAWVPDPGHGYTLIMEDGEVTSYELF